MAAAPCTIVIVNWNAGPLLGRCLRSIAASDLKPARVVVVDNGSTDGSADLAVVEGLEIHLIRAGGNLGFARACNQGAAGVVDGDLLFLNPDTELAPDTLRRLYDWRAGIAGDIISGVRLVDEHGHTAVSCSRFPTVVAMLSKALGLEGIAARFGLSQPMLEFAHDTSRRVDQVMGAFFLVPATLFRRLGGFDERFFVYYEEVDFCLRALQAGVPTWFCAAAQAAHVGGGTSRQVPAFRLFLSLQSRLRYARKHFGMPRYLAAAATSLLIEPVSRLTLAIARRSPADARATLEAYRRLYLG